MSSHGAPFESGRRKPGALFTTAARYVDSLFRADSRRTISDLTLRRPANGRNIAAKVRSFDSTFGAMAQIRDHCSRETFPKDARFAVIVDGVYEIAPELLTFVEWCDQEGLPLTLQIDPVGCRVGGRSLQQHIDSMRERLRIGLCLRREVLSNHLDAAIPSESWLSQRTTQILTRGFDWLSTEFGAYFTGGLSCQGIVPGWIPALWEEIGGRFVITDASPNRGAQITEIRAVRLLKSSKQSADEHHRRYLASVRSACCRRGDVAILVPFEFFDKGGFPHIVRSLLSALLSERLQGVDVESIGGRHPAHKDAIATTTNSGGDTLRQTIIYANQTRLTTLDEGLLDALNMLTLGTPNIKDSFILGCYLTRNNLDVCIEVLDLCEEFCIMPRYLLAPASSSIDQAKEILQESSHYHLILEEIDKELCRRGWSSKALSPAYRCLGDLSEVGKSHLTNRIDISSLIPTNLDHLGHDPSVVPLVSDPVNGSAIIHRPEALKIGGQCSIATTDCRQVLVSAAACRKMNWKNVLAELELYHDVDSCILDIPFFDDEMAVSCLVYRDIAENIKMYCRKRGWEFRGGRRDFTELGALKEDSAITIGNKVISRNHAKVTVSVIVAVHNAIATLLPFLNSLFASAMIEPFEIILIDDGSEDESWNLMKEIARSAPKRLDISLFTLSRSRPYVRDTFTFRAGLARQVGAINARGDFFLFFDPDQIVDASCLEEHHKCLTSGADLVIGVRKYQDADLDYRLRMRLWQLQKRRLEQPWWKRVYTGNCSVRKDAFWRVGGFDLALQFWGLDDSDLGYRLYRSNSQLRIAPRALVTHLPDAPSGGGSVRWERAKSCRFQMEVLYRKYVDDEILYAYQPYWKL